MLENQVPIPPVDMVMPPQYDMILLSNLVILACVVTWTVRVARKSQRGLPVLILVGAVLNSLLECLFDVLVCAWWPQYGHTPLYRMFNMSVPLWMILAYPWYYGGMSVLAYQWFRNGMTQRRLWLLYALGYVGNFLLEIPALQLHLYSYYGTQPFQIMGFPLVMAMTNTLVPILIGALIFSFDDLLVGPKSLIAVVLVPMGMGSAQISTGWPWFIAINSSASYAVANLACLATLGLSLLVTYLIGVKFCRTGVNATRPGA